MAKRKRIALLLGAPVAAAAVVVPATPAHADGPVEQASATFTFTDGNGLPLDCPVALSITTNSQNVSTQDLAGFSITNTSKGGDCFNGTVSQSLTWVSPTGTNMSASHTYTAKLPASQQDIYSPVNGNAKTAKFTEHLSLTFNNCLANCTHSLSLTADGK